MANNKSKEKSIAFSLYMVTALTQKEIAERVGVSEKTLSGWITLEKWEKLKLARNTTEIETVNDLRQLLSELSKDNIQKKKDGKFTKSDADSVLELAKAIDLLEGGIPLRTYVSVMEEFINSIPIKEHNFRTTLAEYQILFLTSKTSR